MCIYSTYTVVDSGNVKKFSLEVIIQRTIYYMPDPVFQKLPNYRNSVSLNFPKLIYFILSVSVSSKRISEAVVKFFETLFRGLKQATLSGIWMSNGIFWYNQV